MIRKTITIFVVGILILSCTKHNSEIVEKLSAPNKFNGIKHVIILEAETLKSQNFISVDTIQYLNGEKATKAYLIDTGNELEEKTFYIRNNSVDSLKLIVSDSLKIIPTTFDYTNGKNLTDATRFEKFKTFINSDVKTYISTLPFKLTIVDDVVILIEEIYIP